MTISDIKENWRKPNANKEFTAAATDDVVIWVNRSGTDTDLEKFMNKGSEANGYILRPAVNNVQIVSILDGSGVELLNGDPLTVAVNTAFTRFWGQAPFVRITLRPNGTSTQIKLTVI